MEQALALCERVFPFIKFWECVPRSTRFGVTYAALLASTYFLCLNIRPGRRIMRFLLYYRGWLNKDSGQLGGIKTSSKIQLRRRLYLSSLWLLNRVVSWERPLMSQRQPLYALQDTLPPLPLPRLRETCGRFLQSMRPLLSIHDFEFTANRIAHLAAAGGEWEHLQCELVKRARACQEARPPSSWLEQWWLEEKLLCNRQPLPVHCNWYGLDRPDTPCASQSERAAWLISAAMRFHKHLSKETLQPLRMMDLVPLCMEQYRRVFHTCRVPGQGKDRLITTTPRPGQSPHLAVMRNGEIFVMDLYTPKGRPLAVQELQVLIEEIIASSDACAQRQPPIGILTTEERDTWARLRTQLSQAHELNAASLALVESAIFILVLEGPAPTTLTEQAVVTFMGQGQNRWFDKSFQLLVFADGVASVNVEGSWADAPVLSHLFGFMHDHENIANFSSVPHLLGDASGKEIKKPKKLKWVMTSELAMSIDKAANKFDKLVKGTELSVSHMSCFGKGFIKKCNMSPDAFVQMALLLAYYRKHGGMPMAMESAHTRQFFHGRTELIRTVSSDAVAFVKAMAHLDTSSAETKLHLLRRACTTHVEKVKEAMNGHGVDRHLFGLEMVAKQRGTWGESGFGLPAFKMPVTLQTSQAPTQRGPSGGFGAVEEGGYTVSYLINEDNMYLHVCHRRKHDAERGEYVDAAADGDKDSAAQCYGKAVERALLDMSVLCTKKAQIAMSHSEKTLDWTDM